VAPENLIQPPVLPCPQKQGVKVVRTNVKKVKLESEGQFFVADSWQNHQEE